MCARQGLSGCQGGGRGGGSCWRACLLLLRLGLLLLPWQHRPLEVGGRAFLLLPLLLLRLPCRAVGGRALNRGEGRRPGAVAEVVDVVDVDLRRTGRRCVPWSLGASRAVN